ncbi:MAG: HEAT repeat domain-containing protein [bacterium]
MRAPTPADLERLAACEGAPADADADWLMDLAGIWLAPGAAPAHVDALVLRRMIFALGRVGAWRRLAATRWLAEVATGPHREAWGSTAVVALLAHAPDPACQPRCLEVAADERLGWGSRLGLAAACGRAGIDQLATLIPQTDWAGIRQARDIQLILLGNLDHPAAADALLALYASADWHQRSLLLEALERPATPERVALLVRAVEGADAPTRRAAVEAFGRLGQPAVGPWLQRCLRDPDADVRRLAGPALGRLGLTPAPAEPPTLAADADPWARLARPGRALPLAFWVDRAVRAGGAYTQLAWALTSCSGVALVVVERPVLAPIGALIGVLWLVVAVPVGASLAWREGRLLRRGIAVPADVTEVRQVIRTRTVRGSRIQNTFYYHHLRFPTSSGDLANVVAVEGRRIVGEGPGARVLHAEGQPDELMLFDALGCLRVDGAGRLRFRPTLPSALALGAVAAVVGSLVALLAR